MSGMDSEAKLAWHRNFVHRLLENSLREDYPGEEDFVSAFLTLPGTLDRMHILGYAWNYGLPPGEFVNARVDYEEFAKSYGLR